MAINGVSHISCRIRFSESTVTLLLLLPFISMDFRMPDDMSLYTSTPTENLEEKISSSQLTKVAIGFYAEVFLVAGSDTVVKIPKANGQALHEIEKRIYERIERHPNILVFFGEHTVYLPDMSGTHQQMKGLSFQYVPNGTLKELLVKTTDSGLMRMVRKRSEYPLLSTSSNLRLILYKRTTSVGICTGACAFERCHTRRCGCPQCACLCTPKRIATLV